MDHTMGYFDLLDAFDADGCPVCRLGLAAVRRYIDAVDYESTGDPALRERLRASLGFCNVHAHQWLGQAHVLGTAVIYADVLAQAVADLRALTFRPQPAFAGLVGLLAPRDRPAATDPGPTATCPVCGVLAETESRLTRTLLAHLPEVAFQDAFARSAGLCLPHLRPALAAAADEATWHALRERAVAREEGLLAQLGEVIRRHDYRRIGEPPGPERGAAERAVLHAIGAPGIPG